MINRIVIQNFQSHKNTELNLSPGVNVIIGKSDSGKTAIYRALYWVTFNHPLGDDFRSHWSGKGDETSVELVFNEGHCIKRIRSNTCNRYEWTKIDDQINQIYDALGQSVPKNIQEIINLEAINFSSQLDPPFLISKSSAEAGRYLNDIIGLDVIDQTISHLNKVEFKERNTINGLERQIGSIHAQLDKYEGLDELIRLDEKIEKKQIWLNEQKKKINQLKSLLNEIQSIQKRIDTLKQLINLSDDLKQIDQTAEVFETQIKNQDHLIELTSEVEKIQKKIQNTKQLLKKEENKFKTLMPEVCPLCGMNSKKI